MERNSGIIRMTRDAGLIVGVTGAVFAGGLGAELVQGADPVIISPETSRQVIEYALKTSFVGFGLGVTMELLDRLIPFRARN